MSTTRTTTTSRLLLGLALAGGALALALASAGCDRGKKGNQGPGGPQGANQGKPSSDDKAKWTPEEISADPAGYLQWYDKRLAREVAAWEATLKGLDAKRQQFAEKAALVQSNVADVENLLVEARKAFKRADDNDRWPTTFAGREFDRAKLEALIKRLPAYVDQERPRHQRYTDFLAQIDRKRAEIRAQIDNARDARERVVLDVERIKLNQSTADLASAQQAQDQLVRMSDSLRQMSEDPTVSGQVPPEPPRRVTIDDLVN